MRRKHSILIAVRALITTLLVSISASLAFAQSNTQWTLESSSMARVPKSVDFYSGSFQLREQCERLLASSLANQIKSTSLYGKIEKEIEAAWHERRGEMARVRLVLENPLAKEAIRFLKDILAEDVFVMADASLSEAVNRLSVLQKKTHLLFDDATPNDEKAEIVYGWIEQLLPGFEIPTILLGAKITNSELAIAKVDELEGLLRFGLGSQPNAKDAIKLLERVDDERGSRLRWRISGDRIPWEFLPTNEILDQESLDRMQELVSEKSLCLTMGILDGYFIFSISGRDDPWRGTTLDESLVHHHDFQLVREQAQHKITSASYVSDKLASAWFDLTLSDFFLQLARRTIFPIVGEQSRESEYRDWLVSIMDDCGWLDTTIGTHVPRPHGFTSVTVLNERGWETQRCDRTQNVLFDGSQPLRGLSHLGQAPLVMLNIHLAEHPEYFRTARTIVKRLRLRMDELLALPPEELPADWSQTSIREILAFWPVLKQLADAWEMQFLPAMDGEHVVVLHTGALASRQWHPSMPESDQALPIPELAILTGIRDQAAWMDGLRSLRASIQHAIEIARNKNPDAIPADLQIPSPTLFEDDRRMVYGYPIPTDCPAPKEMMPRLSLGGGWSIASYSDQQTAAVEQRQPMSIGEGILDSDAPLTKAAHIDVSGIARMLRPWVRFGLLQVQSDLNAPLPTSNSPTSNSDVPLREGISGADILDAWSVLESLGQFTSVSWIDDQGGSKTRAVFTVPR